MQKISDDPGNTTSTDNFKSSSRRSQLVAKPKPQPQRTKRPPGRPPRGKTWDPAACTYVPHSPSLN